jgi:hypothetical protein
VVEQLTVNQLVAGSNPVSGAKKKHQNHLVFFLLFCSPGFEPGIERSGGRYNDTAHRNLFREQTSGEGFSRYPVSGASNNSRQNDNYPKVAFELKRSERDFFDIINL